jgi:hypothetical protein
MSGGSYGGLSAAMALGQVPAYPPLGLAQATAVRIMGANPDFTVTTAGRWAPASYWARRRMVPWG